MGLLFGRRALAAAATILLGLPANGTALKRHAETHAAEAWRWKALLSAKCGIVFVAMGSTYSKIAVQVAKFARNLPAERGWCPRDHQLDHIPVTLFTDLDVTQPEAEVQGVSVRRVHGSSAAAPGDAVSLERDLEVLPERTLAPWTGGDVGTQTQGHLGGWKMRWYHAQALLASPYDLTLYLDVDALPCSARGISRLMQRVHTSRSGLAQPQVSEALHCKTSGGNCTYPHPPFLNPEDKEEWGRFYERNAGVIVYDKLIARPVLKDFAQAIERMASSGLVSGDQYSMREALFKHRRRVPQLVLTERDVCRYEANGECETETTEGCAIHHRCHMKSLVKYGIVRSGTFQSLGLKD